MDLFSKINQALGVTEASEAKNSEDSYFKTHIASESCMEQYEKEVNFLRTLKKNSLDPSDRELSVISNTMPAKLATLLDRPELEAEINQFLPEPNREKLLDALINLIVSKDWPLEEKYEYALRVCIGILTEGVVTAPLDGLVSATIDPVQNFPRLLFAGPIRAVGGSNLIYIVILAEYLRRKLNLNVYKPTTEQIERTIIEIKQYQKKHPGQVRPADHELQYIVKNCTVMIDGVETEIEEMPIHKYLPRINKPRIRGGLSLVYVEGFVIRSKKILGLLEYYNLPEWATWIKQLIALGKTYRKEGQRSSGTETKYSLTMGRPLLSTNTCLNGLRLKIGTTPTVGLAGSNVTKQFIDLVKFVNVGTQLVVDMPGKATCITGVSETLAKPIVRYKSRKIAYYEVGTYDQVEEILDLGEIMFSAGDFIECNRNLPLRDYCESCWTYDTKHELKWSDLTEEEHLTVNKKYPGAKLHPHYAMMIDALEFKEYFDLRNKIKKNDYTLTESTLKVLKKLNLLCTYSEDRFYPTYEKAFKHYLLLDHKVSLVDYLDAVSANSHLKNTLGSNLTLYINDVLKQHDLLQIPEKGYSTLSARVGRCEAIHLSKVKPKPFNALINYKPTIKTNSFWAAIEKKPWSYTALNLRYCYSCKLETEKRVCSNCKNETKYCFKCLNCKDYYLDTLTNAKKHGTHLIKKYCNVKINYEQEIAQLKALGLETSPLKTVAKNYPIRTVTNRPGVLSYEPLIKGYFRSKRKLFVTKDGTIRTTFCNASATHFTPQLINTSVEKLRSLGYHKDVNNETLVRPDQVLRLKFSDAIVSYESAHWYLEITRFLDDIIYHYYKGPKYYNFKDIYDMVGLITHMISPHTSSAVLGRVIGYTRNYCVYSHPLAVACRRRDVDGDLDAAYVSADMILNSSKKYIPEHKRGALMSVPITLTTKYAVNQVGKEVLSLELDHNYYDGTLTNTKEHTPADLKKLKRFECFLDKEITEYDMAYNVKNFSFDVGTYSNWYKDSEDSAEKLTRFINVTEKLSYLDKKDIYMGLIQGHLLPDIVGNLNAFYRQDYKCQFCDYKYGRIPLSLTCVKCNIGAIKPTVYPGMILKYYPILKFFESLDYLPLYLTQKITSLDLILSSFKDDSKTTALSRLINSEKCD